VNILVVNCGSSSLKYQLFDMPDERVLVKGNVEKIGAEDAIHGYKTDAHEGKDVKPILDHKEALRDVLAVLTSAELGILTSPADIDAIGHRVVHGGEQFALSTVINEEVTRAIRDTYDLAPLHNPANMQGIEAMEAVLPGVPQVAVFDTAFHQTMPKEHYLYPLPYVLYQRYKIRRYGFHGTSHRYVSSRVPHVVGKDLSRLKIISCHIGNGASLAAIENGRSVDTSMGMTPLEGVMMGTRSGDVDPSVLEFVIRKEGLSEEQLANMLNKHSGLYGVSGVTGDMRQIEEERSKGNARAALAFSMYEYRIRKYIGAYIAAMNGCDVLLFTAGVGENSATLRREICENLSYLGVLLDHEANEKGRGERIISKPDSTVTLCVIPTNEELMIARDTHGLVTGLQNRQNLPPMQ